MSVRKVKKKNVTFLLKIIGLITILIAIDLSWYLFVIDIKKFKTENPKKTAFMKFRERQWKQKDRKIKLKQIWVPLRSISGNAQKAVIISEDAKFWMHDGFDFDAMQKAIEMNLKKRKIAVGASTITMQLAKNLFLSPSKTPVRKVHEAILTWRIEKNLSKKRILELYLNVAEWGDGIFGIEAASRVYFHHSASTLSKKEAALLAAVLPNPIRYHPLKKSRFVERRSRLIQNALGGDVNAAMALHAIKPDETAPEQRLAEVNDSEEVKADSTDSGIVFDTAQFKTQPVLFHDSGVLLPVMDDSVQ